MDPYRRLRVLFAAATAVTLVACGGGGGGGSDSQDGISDGHGGTGTVTPTPSPAASGDPAAPTDETGLSEPSLTITDTLQKAVYLATSVRNAAAVAPQGAAAIALAKVTPANGNALSNPLQSCTGGSVTVGTSGSHTTYTYNACTVGDYTFSGTATLTGSPSSFTVDFSSGLQLTRAGGTEALAGTLSCVKSEDASTPAKCTAYVNDFRWGYDVLYTSAGAQGTHQCGCNTGTWNVTFYDMTTTSGTAYILGKSGVKAYVTRKSDLDFLVTLDFGGNDRTSYTVAVDN